MRHTVFTRLLFTAVLFVCSGLTWADVTISNAWVRASAPGQSVGAAYMTMQSAQAVTLVYAETARAGSVEMHSMSMQNGVMKMRQMDTLSLPAGKLVKLAPGGLHLMLFDLSAPFKAGEQIQFRLCFRDSQGKISEQYVLMPVQAAP